MSQTKKRLRNANNFSQALPGIVASCFNKADFLIFWNLCSLKISLICTSYSGSCHWGDVRYTEHTTIDLATPPVIFWLQVWLVTCSIGILFFHWISAVFLGQLFSISSVHLSPGNRRSSSISLCNGQVLRRQLWNMHVSNNLVEIVFGCKSSSDAVNTGCVLWFHY